MKQQLDRLIETAEKLVEERRKQIELPPSILLRLELVKTLKQMLDEIEALPQPRTQEHAAPEDSMPARVQEREQNPSISLLRDHLDPPVRRDGLDIRQTNLTDSPREDPDAYDQDRTDDVPPPPPVAPHVRYEDDFWNEDRVETPIPPQPPDPPPRGHYLDIGYGGAGYRPRQRAAERRTTVGVRD